MLSTYANFNLPFLERCVFAGSIFTLVNLDGRPAGTIVTIVYPACVFSLSFPLLASSLSRLKPRRSRILLSHAACCAERAGAAWCCRCCPFVCRACVTGGAPQCIYAGSAL